MTWNAKHSQGNRRQHYRNWAAIPGNLERKAAEVKALREYRVSLGLCYRCGNRPFRPGFVSCGRC